jgi:hypothetical protein
MPIYEYQGQKYEITDTDPDVAKSKILNYLASQEAPVPEYIPEPATGISSFVPAVKRGALGLQSLVGDVLPAMAGRVGEKLGIQGAGDYATRQMQEAQEAQQYIQQMYPSAVPSYTDIKSGGDFLTYVVESVGELIPSILPSIFTGGAAGVVGRGAVVAAEQAAKKAATDAAKRELMKDSVQAAIKSGAYGGQKETLDAIKTVALEAGVKAGREAAQKTALKYQAVGAVGGSALQNVPEVYQNIAEETGKEDLGAALVFGGFNSVLDAITPLALLRKAKGIGLTEKELIGAWYKRAGKGALTGFATEGATEAVQEMSSAAAEKFVDENKNFFTEKNFERFINAGLKGGIGGAAISGAANIPFGQKEPQTPVTTTEPGVVPPTTTEAAPAQGKSTADEIIAEAEGKAKKEETIDTKGGQDATDRIDDTGSGDGAQIPSGSESDRAAPKAAAPERTGVADAGGIAEQAGARDAEQQGTLEGVKKEEVLPEVVKQVEEPVVAAPAVVTPPKAPPNAPEQIDPFLQKLIETEKTRQKGLVKDTRTLEDKAMQVRLAPKTKEQEVQRQQQIKALQTKQAKELAKDIKLTPEQKESNKAAKNYLAAANNDEKTALRYLAFDLGAGVKGGKGSYKPGTGGAMATAFYKSLTPEQKKVVDAEKDNWATIEARTTTEQEKQNKAIEARKKQEEKDIKSVTMQMAKKKAIAEKDEVEKQKVETKLEKAVDLQREINEVLREEGDLGFGIEKPATYSYYDLNRDLYGQASDVYGGTNADLMGHLLHGDLHSALEVITKDTTKTFTPIDKEVVKKLLMSKSLPSVSVEPTSFIKELADANGIKGVPHGVYSNGADHIYLNEKTGLNSHIVLHEVTHGYTVSLIRAVEKGIVQNAGVKDLAELYNFLKNNYPELATEYAFETKDLAEFASEVMSNRNLQDKLKAIPYKRLNAFTEFARAILRMLGIGENDRSNALAAALISTDRILGTGRTYQETAQFESTISALAPVAEGKAPKEPLKPELKEYKSADDYIASISGQPEPTASKVKKAFTSVPGVKELVRLFQNERYPIKNWEDKLAMANLMVYSGDNTRAVYTQIALSTGRAEDEFLVKMYNPSNALYEAIGNYAKAKNIDEETALKQLQGVFVALHEQERRHVKYLLSVPLNAKAAETRENILKAVRSSRINESTAKELRTYLETLVANNKQEKGFGFNAESSNFSLDETSDYYNVAGIRPQIRDDILAKYYTADKAIIDPIRTALRGIHQATIDLNKKANYWSEPVSNIVAFYGFENYVPLKGRPDKKEKESKVDELLDFSSKSNGSELQEKEVGFDGRVSESENPLLQTLSDGVRAALRAGRGGTYTNPDGTTEQYGITLAIKNAIDYKDKNGNSLLEGKKLKTVKFEDRYKVADDEALTRGENTFFHYNPDGSIDIYAIYDPKIREAVRRSYRASQPLLDALNNTTSLMGQFHTRYNVAFAPMNFIRDTLTNAFTMGAEMGVGTVGAVASKVAQGGLARALKVSMLYKNGEFDKIEALGKKDPYIKAMYEYIQQGGKVSYVSGIGAKSQFEQMQKTLGRKGIATTKAQIDGVIDIWTNMFEFASRTAAYQVVKENYMNGPQKLSEREAQVKATAYVKNLANFEQVGLWGKSLGAIFMFFRPSATGAVRAIESLVPLFRNIDTALAGLPEAARNDPKAVAAFRENMIAQRRAAAGMLMSLAGAGAVLYLMASMLAEDDEDGRNKVATDDMARWTRYARFHIPGTDVIFQIPWGFGLGAFASAGAQITAFGSGNNSLKDTFNNIKDVGFDAFLPLPASRINMWENPAAWAMDSVTPSLFRPFFEYAMNLDGLGREIYNNRQTRSGDAYTGGDNIPEFYKDAAKLLANITNGAVDFSPNTMYFFANNYADGLTRLIHNSYNIGMVGTMQKDFNPKTDTLAFDMFFGAKSNFDAREFSKMENMIKDKERKLNMFKNQPERYMDYIAANPYDQGIVDIYNKGVNGDLKKVRELANKYRAMPDLTPKERKELLDNVKEQQNLIKRHLIEVFKAYDELN